MEARRLELDRLPLELLSEIARHLGSESLLSLCLASRLLNHVAERELYAHVDIIRCRAAERFSSALWSRPDRRRLVRTACINSTADERRTSDRTWSSWVLCPQLMTCRNLEKLEMASVHVSASEVPRRDPFECDNMLCRQHNFFDTLRNSALHTPPQDRILNKLSILHLYFESNEDGRPEWGVGPELMSIFLSPTLREIWLHRCRFVPRDNETLSDLHYHTFRRETPLETLRLMNSIVRVDVLQKLMSLPRRLKLFHLEPFLGLDHSAPNLALECFSDLDALTDLLMLQEDALEEIVLLPEVSVLESSKGCLDMRKMEKLRSLKGDVFVCGCKNVRIPANPSHVQTTVEFYKYLFSTRPDWDRWRSNDRELVRFDFEPVMEHLCMAPYD